MLRLPRRLLAASSFTGKGPLSSSDVTSTSASSAAEAATPPPTRERRRRGNLKARAAPTEAKPTPAEATEPKRRNDSTTKRQRKSRPKRDSAASVSSLQPPVLLPWQARPWPLSYEEQQDDWDFLNRTIAMLMTVSPAVLSYRSFVMTGRDILKDVADPCDSIRHRRRAAERKRLRLVEERQRRQRQEDGPQGTLEHQPMTDTENEMTAAPRTRPKRASHTVKRAAAMTERQGRHKRPSGASTSDNSVTVHLV